MEFITLLLSFDSRRPFSSVENLYAKCGTSPPGSVQPPLQHHFPISPTISQAPPLMPLTPPPSNSSSSSSASSTVVVQRTPPPAAPHMSFAAYPQGHHQLPCPVTRPLPQMTHQPQLHPLHPGGPNIISRPPPPPPTIHHQLQHQHQQQQQQQQQQQHQQQPPQEAAHRLIRYFLKLSDRKQLHQYGRFLLQKSMTSLPRKKRLIFRTSIM